MTATLSQDAESLNLEWVEGDPISLAFTVQAVNWSGTYQAQVRQQPRADSDVLISLTVSATYDAPDTDFTLTATAVASAGVPAGEYVWDLQQVGGVTRLRGKVRVTPQVTR